MAPIINTTTNYEIFPDENDFNGEPEVMKLYGSPF